MEDDEIPFIKMAADTLADVKVRKEDSNDKIKEDLKFIAGLLGTGFVSYETCTPFHEFGHYIVAKQLGWTIHDAKFFPDDPFYEFLEYLHIIEDKDFAGAAGYVDMSGGENYAAVAMAGVGATTALGLLTSTYTYKTGDPKGLVACSMYGLDFPSYCMVDSMTDFHGDIYQFSKETGISLPAISAIGIGTYLGALTLAGYGIYRKGRRGTDEYIKKDLEKSVKNWNKLLGGQSEEKKPSAVRKGLRKLDIYYSMLVGKVEKLADTATYSIKKKDLKQKNPYEIFEKVIDNLMKIELFDPDTLDMIRNLDEDQIVFNSDVKGKFEIDYTPVGFRRPEGEGYLEGGSKGLFLEIPVRKRIGNRYENFIVTYRPRININPKSVRRNAGTELSIVKALSQIYVPAAMSSRKETWKMRPEKHGIKSYDDRLIDLLYRPDPLVGVYVQKSFTLENNEKSESSPELAKIRGYLDVLGEELGMQRFVTYFNLSGAEIPDPLSALTVAEFASAQKKITNAVLIKYLEKTDRTCQIPRYMSQTDAQKAMRFLRLDDRYLNYGLFDLESSMLAKNREKTKLEREIENAYLEKKFFSVGVGYLTGLGLSTAMLTTGALSLTLPLTLPVVPIAVAAYKCGEFIYDEIIEKRNKSFYKSLKIRHP